MCDTVLPRDVFTEVWRFVDTRSYYAWRNAAVCDIVRRCDVLLLHVTCFRGLHRHAGPASFPGGRLGVDRGASRGAGLGGWSRLLLVSLDTSATLRFIGQHNPGCLVIYSAICFKNNVEAKLYQNVFLSMYTCNVCKLWRLSDKFCSSLSYCLILMCCRYTYSTDKTETWLGISIAATIIAVSGNNWCTPASVHRHSPYV